MESSTCAWLRSQNTLVPEAWDGVSPELQHLEFAHGCCLLMHGTSCEHFDYCFLSGLWLLAGFGRAFPVSPGHLLSASLHLAQQSTALPESTPMWGQDSGQVHVLSCAVGLKQALHAAEAAVLLCCFCLSTLQAHQNQTPSC